MSDPVSFAELETQHVELLPARTVLSTLPAQGDSGADSGPSLGTIVTSTLGLNPGSNGADGTAASGDTGAENT